MKHVATAVNLDNQKSNLSVKPKNTPAPRLNYDAIHHDLAAKIDQILAESSHDPTKLVGILLEIQDIIPKRYISMSTAAYIAEKLEMPLTRVYDVITFYDALSDHPRANHIIQICHGISCQANDHIELEALLKRVLGIKVSQATADGKFYLEYATCFGACDVSPAIRIDNEVYGNLTESKLRKIVEDYRKGGF